MARTEWLPSITLQNTSAATSDTADYYNASSSTFDNVTITYPNIPWAPTQSIPDDDDSEFIEDEFDWLRASIEEICEASGIAA